MYFFILLKSVGSHLNREFIYSYHHKYNHTFIYTRRDCSSYKQDEQILNENPNFKTNDHLVIVLDEIGILTGL